MNKILFDEILSLINIKCTEKKIKHKLSAEFILCKL